MLKKISGWTSLGRMAIGAQTLLSFATTSEQKLFSLGIRILYVEKDVTWMYGNRYTNTVIVRHYFKTKILFVTQK
jgi:hypothetical protein